MTGLLNATHDKALPPKFLEFSDPPSLRSIFIMLLIALLGIGLIYLLTFLQWAIKRARRIAKSIPGSA